MAKKDFVFEHCIVTKITDGDTFHAVVDTGFGNTHTDVFRMIGINAPETRGESKEQGLISKQWLTDKILNKEVRIVSHGGDKYGRWLATVYLGDENINAQSLNEGYSVEYN